MLDRLSDILTPTRRRWFYRVATAGLIVLGVYGIVTDEQAAAWNILFAAITGMAAANTDTTDE